MMIQTTCKQIAALAITLSSSAVLADEPNRVLFNFDSEDMGSPWRTVNDGVMGGRSDGRARLNDNGTMTFFGSLSLENNGGFASVRSIGTRLGLQPEDSIVVRVRGDGREYSLNLYEPTRQVAFAYRAKFRTRQDEWIEVSVPLSQFVATSFGRVVQNAPLRPAEINGIGILLGDKQAGPFRLDVDWIKVRKRVE